MSQIRRSKVGGLIGQEIDALWEQIRRQQIQPSAGQRIRRTPNGTIVEAIGGAGQEIGSPLFVATEGEFLYHPYYTSYGYFSLGSFPFDRMHQAAVWMNLGPDAGGEQLVLLPPIHNVSFASGTYNNVQHFPEGKWPEMGVTYISAFSSSTWKWEGELQKNNTYAVKKFSSQVFSDTHNLADKGLNGEFISNTQINYYLDTDQGLGPATATWSGFGWG